MESNLPPLDFSQEVEEYEAYSESKEVKFIKCPHKNTKIVDGKLSCTCGAAWSDNTSNLVLLQKLLYSR